MTTSCGDMALNMLLMLKDLLVYLNKNNSTKNFMASDVPPQVKLSAWVAMSRMGMEAYKSSKLTAKEQL